MNAKQNSKSTATKTRTDWIVIVGNFRYARKMNDRGEMIKYALEANRFAPGSVDAKNMLETAYGASEF
jgi:hypothetical protein